MAGLLVAVWLLVGGIGVVRAQSLPDAGTPRVDDGAGPAPPDAGTPSAGPDAGRGGVASFAKETGPPRETDASLSPRRDASDDSEAPTIASVDLTCDLSLCSNPVESDKFLRLAALYPGRRLDEQTLETARLRLVKTGIFKAIDFRIEETVGGGRDVTVVGEGARRIRSVQFRGVAPPPFRSELRRLLIYHPGEVYDEDVSKRSTQLGSLEAEFRKEGYFGTEISLQVDPVPDHEKLVDLTFQIDKGYELDICHIGLRGVEAMTYAEARSLLLQGMPFYSRRLELIAPRYTSENVETGEEALVQTYRKLGHFRARIVDKAVQKDRNSGCVTILLDVDEGPQWKVAFEGNEALTDQRLTRELPFYETGYVDDQEIERAERQLEALYETRGYPFARVSGSETRIDRLNRRITFEVEEGAKFQIADVVLHDNEALSDRELTSDLGTRAFQLFGTGGLLQTDQLLSDIRRIEQAYRERGYLRARVQRYELELDRADGEMRIHLYIREGPQVTTRDVRYEGMRHLDRTRLRSKTQVQTDSPFVPVQVRADRSRIQQLYSSVGYPLANVRTTCHLPNGRRIACRRPELPAGCVADTADAIEKRCEWTGEARTRLSCQRVRESCDFASKVVAASGATPPGGPNGGSSSEQIGGSVPRELSGADRTREAPRSSSPTTLPSIGDHTEVRVVHHVEEGPLVTVEEFLVQGNFATRDWVVLQEIPLSTGEIFNVKKILKGQSNLRSLGIFDSVSIEAIGLDRAAADAREQGVALLVSVQESRNQFLDMEVGFEGRDIFGEEQKLLTTAQLQYNNRNLFGIGDQLKPRIFGAVDSLQLFRWGRSALGGDPINFERFDYLVGAELVYHDPRFLKGATGIDKLSLTLTPFYLRDLIGLVDEEFLREEWGVRLEFRKELTELLERFFINVGLEGKQTATVPSDNDEGVPSFTPRRITGKLIPELTLDRRNNPLLPTSGYRLKFTPEYVTGDALSRQLDAFGDSYFRLNWTASLFVPLWRQLVLAQSFRYGQVVPAAGREVPVPPDERYHLGGAGSLRGFPNNSVGPRWVNQPNGGEFLLNYTLELRFPLLNTVNVRGAVFLDSGLLVDCFPEQGEGRHCYEDAFSSRAQFRRNLRSSAGLGLRYVIGGQIPVLFDYGIVLDRRKGEGFGSLHFHLGYTF